MIYYIKNEVDGAYIYPNRRRSGPSAITVIKKICFKHLTTFDGYVLAVKKITDVQYKIPIVLNRKYVFFSTKSFKNPESIWINYMAIKEIAYLDKAILFIFDERYQLKVEMTTKNYQRLVSVIFKVLKYKESLE